MLQRFQFAVLLLNLIAVTALGVNMTNFDGVYKIYKLLEGEAPNRQEISLPSPDFVVRLQAKNETASQQYRLMIKLGNRLAGDATISESAIAGRDAFALDGPMVSTRMMPPPEIYAVEQVVLRIVPEIELIYFDKDDKLVLQGPTGLMRCTKSTVDE